MATDTSSEDQKQRTLEALKRRFAVAEAEVLQQHKKRSKPIGEDAKVTSSLKFSPSTPSTKKQATPPLNNSVNNSVNKDTEENSPEYLPLSQHVHSDLLKTTIEFKNTRKNFVDKYLLELLQRGDSSQKYMQGSRGVKLDNCWILLDNFVKGHGISTCTSLRVSQSHSKRSKKHISVKQHKKYGSYDLPQQFQKYSIFKPMNEMWLDYMTQLLKTSGKHQLAKCLLNADLHGARITVVECKISAFTGLHGIVIRETAQAFAIITQDDKLRVVPKKASVFVFLVDCWKITLHGDKLTSRNFA